MAIWIERVNKKPKKDGKEEAVSIRTKYLKRQFRNELKVPLDTGL